MSSPSQPTVTLRAFLLGTTLAAVTIGLLPGCSSAPESPTISTTRIAPALTHVATGEEVTAAEAIAAGHEGDFVLVGSGESMMPYYQPGTAVVVHPTSFFMLRPGMVVVYRNRFGAQVAHVLIEQSGSGWVARGTNNADADDDPVTAVNLVGIIRHAFVADASVPIDPGVKLAGLDHDARSRVALLH